MKKRNGKKTKFKNPHYTPRKHLPARNKRSKPIIAKFFSSKRGGVAFRITNPSELPENREDTVILPKNGGIIGVSDGMRQWASEFIPQLDESVKYYIDRNRTASAVNGDIVVIQPTARNDAEVVDILLRASSEVCGTAHEAEDEDGNAVWVVVPDDTKLDFDIIVTEPPYEGTPAEGDKVLVHITLFPDDEWEDAEGVILRVYGAPDSKKANYQAILDENSVVTEFSAEALLEAEEMASEVLTPDGRVDLRDRFIFTLDGADAKDLDDAISVRRDGDNYILGVHIADVSHYVRHRTRLDREAMGRGTSIYFADRVVPMLPEALSNGICSLNAHVDRYAMTAEMTLDRSGDILKTELCKSIIRSSLRGVYSEFNAVIAGEADEATAAKYAVIPQEMLESACELYEILKAKSARRGALELDSEEAAIVLDENGDPVGIVRRERGFGEMLIEQFMLCANEGVATWMSERGIPCVYRIHEQPDEEKLGAFLDFAHNLGLQPEYIRRGGKISASYFSRILDRARERGIGTPVSYMLLRTMMKARYSEICSGHFGLGSERYCHFTSPIRRYPDLTVHRIISAMLKKGSAEYVRDKYAGFTALSARSSSDCELRALTVEREMDDLFKAIYLS
ncbi:MAG: VacB/RNase II family 3'-5' exoribonuclease, partial [Clostridia bacterium]|nr:VacB/RNase II family 3'-5' exoribonuclease [Clostridia bacterium]